MAHPSTNGSSRKKNKDNEQMKVGKFVKLKWDMNSQIGKGLLSRKKKSFIDTVLSQFREWEDAKKKSCQS